MIVNKRRDSDCTVFEWLSMVISKPTCRRFIWAVVICLYLLRIVGLDSDVPPWGVMAYQPIDEGIYSALALNQYNLGSVNPADYYGPGVGLMSSQDIATVVMNAITYFFMRVFGDNYYGFRMGSVAIGLVSLLVLARMIRLVFEAVDDLKPCARLAQFAGVLVFLTSFAFYNASRIVEPSLLRMLFAMLLVCCYVDYKRSFELRSFLAGFITIASVFFVYNTNVFFGILVCGFLVFLVHEGNYGAVKTYLAFGSAGACVAYLLAIPYYAAWGTSPLANILIATGAFSGSANSGSGGSYTIGLSGAIVGNALDFLASNVALYELPLLALFVGLVPTLFGKNSANLRRSLLCPLLMVGGFLLQTLLVSDYIVRKELVISPFLLVTVLAEAASLRKDLSQGGKRVGFAVAGTLGCLAVCIVAYYRMIAASNVVVTAADFSDKDRVIVFFTCGMTVALIAFLLFYVLRRSSRRTYAVITALGVVALCMNGLFIYKYNVRNQTYSERDAMISIGEVADGKVVAGDYFYGFTLYNNALPLKNDRNALLPYLGSHQDAFFFDYAGANGFTVDPLDTWQTLETVEEYQRSYRNRQAASTRDVALYRSTYRKEQ